MKKGRPTHKNRFFVTAVFLLLSILIQSCTCKDDQSIYSLVLVRQGVADVEICTLPAQFESAFQSTKTVDNIKVDVLLEKVNNYITYKATAIATTGEAKVYLSLKARYKKSTPWNYNGEVTRTEIYRQSPHDVNAWITDSLAKQAVPMIGFRNNNGLVTRPFSTKTIPHRALIFKNAN
jgi:hypothetical protein